MPARAVEASPSTSARITASPTRNTVALPTHITLLAAPLSMQLTLLCLLCAEAEHTLRLVTLLDRCNGRSLAGSKLRYLEDTYPLARSGDHSLPRILRSNGSV